MEKFHKVVVIHPNDPSIHFLKPIVQNLIKIKPDLMLLNLDQQDSHKYNKQNVIDDETDLIIFLGHGSSYMLYGSVSDSTNKRPEYLHAKNASKFFKKSSIIILSCRSAEFIGMISPPNEFGSFFGYGDLPTDWDHISYLRETNPNPSYLIDFNEEHLSYYKSAIVESITYGLSNIGSDKTFRSLYLGTKHIINKKISDVLLNKSWNKKVKFEMVELLCNLKNELLYS